MSKFTYTPYDGSAIPFTMGMKPCPEDQWIEQDRLLAEQLRLKANLLEQKKDQVYASVDGMREAEQEVLELLCQHLAKNFPEKYGFDGAHIELKFLERTFRLSDYADEPLTLAGRLVQEDLCLIRASDQGHVLSAACLCFPSSWSLREKIGRPMERVHDPVPGYQDKLAQKVNFLMDRITPDRIVWRMNWSLDEGPDLFRPQPHSHEGWLAAGEDPLEHIYIRVERQTIRRLPGVGDILFTIRIYMDKLSALAAHPDVPELAAGLLRQLNSMSADEIEYKGLVRAGEVIKTRLVTLI